MGGCISPQPGQGKVGSYNRYSFWQRGIPVVLGGVHPTLMPDEAARHADSVVVGYAERTWPQLLHDFTAGRMRERYTITEDAQAAYLAACHAQGQRIGDIKPIVLHRMGGWTQVFRGQRLS